MHVAWSKNSSVDELPAPGDYRTGCPEGEGIMPEVPWTSDKRMGGVFVLVELFRTNFMCRINSSGYFNSTGNSSYKWSGGGGSIFGMLEEYGERMGSVFLIMAFF